MKSLTRRSMVKLASAAALVPLSASVSWADERHQDHAGEDLVVGPFALGELYRTMPEKAKLGEVFSKRDGPDEKQVINSLDEVELYVLDKRVRNDKGQWVFDQARPSVVVGGRMTLLLKDKKRKDFNIQLKKVTGRGWNRRNYWEGADKPPSRESDGLLVEMATSRYFLREVSISGSDVEVWGSDFNLVSRPFMYDVFGKVIWKE